MRAFALISGIVLTWMVATTMYAETADGQPRARTIPLEEIWAYEMPGTRDMRELEPDRFGIILRDLGSAEQARRKDQSLTYRIRNRLGVAKLGMQAGPGFAVLGTGKESLRGAHAVLVEGRKPRDLFPLHSEISLVFFSKVFDYYVHLDKVEQQGTRITIKYFFVPHRETIGTSHFALIPLGELPVGEWQVDLVRSPWPDAPKFSVHPEPGAEADPIVVCRPFSFAVETADDQPRARSIPMEEIWAYEMPGTRDANGNGVVDAADYVVWRKNFGLELGSGSVLATAVSEPGTYALLAAVIPAFLLARRRRDAC